MMPPQPPTQAPAPFPIQPLAQIVAAYLASHGVPPGQMGVQVGETTEGGIAMTFVLQPDPAAAARSRILVPR